MRYGRLADVIRNRRQKPLKRFKNISPPFYTQLKQGVNEKRGLGCDYFRIDFRTLADMLRAMALSTLGNYHSSVKATEEVPAAARDHRRHKCACPGITCE